MGRTPCRAASAYSRAMAHPPGTVLVTGGTGYVGTEVVKQFLEKGYSVRTTVRPGTSPTLVDPLLRLAATLPGAGAGGIDRHAGRAWGMRPVLMHVQLHTACDQPPLPMPGSLHVVEANLLGERPFHDAVKGAHAVVHVASPFFIASSDPDRELVDTAVRGTAAVFDAVQAEAAASGQPPPRVVLTSSCAAVKGMRPAAPAAGDRYSDADWNTTSTVEGGEAYWVGKASVWLVAGRGLFFWGGGGAEGGGMRTG